MIKRLVKLQFQEEHREEFIQVFRKHRAHMLTHKICESLQLVEDIHQSGLFFTESIWDSEEALEVYRESDYFREIWGIVKPWFLVRAEAWSVRKL